MQLIRALLGAGRATEALLAFRTAIYDLGAVGQELTHAGEQAARGVPDLVVDAATPPGYGYDDVRAGRAVLCTRLHTGDDDREPGLGTLCLLVDAGGGVPLPSGSEWLVGDVRRP